MRRLVCAFVVCKPPEDRFSRDKAHMKLSTDIVYCLNRKRKIVEYNAYFLGAQWLSGRVPKGRGFEPHRRHCVVSLSKNINPSLVLVQPRKTRPFITERLLMGRKESNKQTNKTMLTLNSLFLKPNQVSFQSSYQSLCQNTWSSSQVHYVTETGRGLYPSGTTRHRILSHLKR